MDLIDKFLSVTIWVTNLCNMKCTYCYEGQDKNNKKMSVQTAENVIDWILSYMNEKKYKFLNIRFHGGEPTINIEVIRYIIDRLKLQKKCSCFYELTTNGYNVSDEDIKFLCLNISELSISIDGNRESHDKYRVDINGKGTYEKTLMCAYKMLKQKEDLTIRMTINPENVGSLFADVKLLRDKGFKKFNICPNMYHDNWTIAEVDELEEQCCKIRNKIANDKCEFSLPIGQRLVKLASCGGGDSSFNILPNGKIYPCTCAVEEEYCIGDVFSGINIVKLNRIREIANMFLPICKECGGYESCICVRCKFMNKKITGDYLIPVALFCELHRRNSGWK